LIFLAALPVLFLLIHALAIVALLRKRDKKHVPEFWPRISVWVAARNEESHIRECLEHLNRLDYPREKLQILIGNDRSEDKTKAIAEDYIKDKPWFTLVDIEGFAGKARKKANVLAQLAHRSSGDYYLLCDADMEVKPGWAKILLAHFSENTGVVSSTTRIKPESFFARMQGLEWIYFMGLLKSAANIGIPCTAIGNNMAVKKEAYQACGGYENIDFSITEDFKLFQEIRKRGWGWGQVLDANATSISEPVCSLSGLMVQRKRWLIGGKELPLYWKALVLIFGAFIPAVLILFFFFPGFALLAWLLKLLLQNLFFLIVTKRSGGSFSLKDALLYEPYFLAINFITPVFLLLPGGKKWKGRSF
jgi:cellulose synthase/poly-beta-1,6-N-acetylglucosamine synthase-like glycosyltransferase